ncbi:carbohydrate kinase family protein [Staphylococcus argensis]|uniref:Carbohydrate kinase n=1 Tax=Staphylococcus argensis TaxID=1607738 RepID=A0A2K4FCM9_9STAP|nr:carbohydrate kinase [Staphylococcus argensis]MCY6992216.1 carbohydrate kinase [Staphylococcus argensis]POA09114.1 carbohydrate kinase [Staphylococcus argensis]
MRHLFAIGEALIDFIPNQTDILLKDVEGFTRQVGGAPCNVAATVAKLGDQAEMVTQLGEDAFGDLIVSTLDEIGVGTKHVLRTSEAMTALAFVSLTASGARDFSFYRKPSADMLYDKVNIETLDVHADDIMHFCSVDLVESEMREAHQALIDTFHRVGGTVVFDPNVRLPLWDSPEACQQAIRQFIPQAHIVKISDEELEFVTGKSNEREALDWLFQGQVEAVVYTKGAEGATLYLADGTELSHGGFKVQPIDTTGAGDAFIGAFIARLLEEDKQSLSDLLKKNGEDMLRFSNYVASVVTTQYGAISSIPEREAVEAGLNKEQ